MHRLSTSAKCVCRHPKAKVAIVNVLKDEGYVRGFEVQEDGVKQNLVIELKYVEGRGVHPTVWTATASRVVVANFRHPKICPGYSTGWVSADRQYVGRAS